MCRCVNTFHLCEWCIVQINLFTYTNSETNRKTSPRVCTGTTNVKNSLRFVVDIYNVPINKWFIVQKSESTAAVELESLILFPIDRQTDTRHIANSVTEWISILSAVTTSLSLSLFIHSHTHTVWITSTAFNFMCFILSIYFRSPIITI